VDLCCFVSAKHQGPQHPHGPGARPKERRFKFKKVKTTGPSGAGKQMATDQADEGAAFVLLVIQPSVNVNFHS